jgi:hypothetical protein
MSGQGTVTVTVSFHEQYVPVIVAAQEKCSPARQRHLAHQQKKKSAIRDTHVSIRDTILPAVAEIDFSMAYQLSCTVWYVLQCDSILIRHLGCVLHSLYFIHWGKCFVYQLHIIFRTLIIMLPALFWASAVFAAPTIEEIVSKFEQVEEQLFCEQTFFVRYTSIVAEKRLIPKSGNPLLSVVYLNGRDGDIWGIGTELAPAPGITETDARASYAQNGLVLDWTTSNDHAVVAPFEFGRNSYNEWYYFFYYGFVPFRHIAESNNVKYEDLLEHAKKADYLEKLNDYFLPDCIRDHPARYKVQEEQEIIDGHLCWVIEWSNTDKIWMDANTNVIRKRITHWSEGGVLKHVILNHDFKEVKNGLFLPMKQDVMVYVGPDWGLPQSQWGKEHSHFVYQVNAIQFGSLDEEAKKFFSVPLPIGTSVYDVRENLEYRIYDESKDPFEDPIKQGIGVLQKRERMAMWRFIGIVILNVCIIIIFMWLYLRHKARQDRENQEKNGDKTKK